MPIHDIHVQHLNAGPFHTPDIFTQTCEISGENRWKNLKHVLLPSGRPESPYLCRNIAFAVFRCRNFQTL